MKNSKNKVVAALVCGIIMGSIGTSFIGNFQAESLANSQNQSIDSNDTKQYSSDSNSTENSYPQREGKKSGHHGYQSQEEDTTPTIDASTSNLKDGTYSGTANGYAPNLNVEVTVSSGRITNVEIVSHNESPGFYERAFEQVPTSIVNEQSTDVDTVSGATYSSKGIINAVEDALSEASSQSSSTTNSSLKTTSN